MYSSPMSQSAVKWVFSRQTKIRMVTLSKKFRFSYLLFHKIEYYYSSNKLVMASLKYSDNYFIAQSLSIDTSPINTN